MSSPLSIRRASNVLRVFKLALFAYSPQGRRTLRWRLCLTIQCCMESNNKIWGASVFSNNNRNNTMQVCGDEPTYQSRGRCHSSHLVSNTIISIMWAHKCHAIAWRIATGLGNSLVCGGAQEPMRSVTSMHFFHSHIASIGVTVAALQLIWPDCFINRRIRSDGSL